jgi:hypothetical protein
MDIAQYKRVYRELFRIGPFVMPLPFFYVTKNDRSPL